MRTEEETQMHEFNSLHISNFGLQNIQRLNKKTVQCDIEFVKFLPGDSLQVSIARTGSLLAVLGSCAMALHGPFKVKYSYHANKAFLVDAAGYDGIFKDNELPVSLLAQASIITLNIARLSGKAETRILTPEGVLVLRMTIAYKVMPRSSFLEQAMKAKARKLTNKSIAAENDHSKQNVVAEGSGHTLNAQLISRSGKYQGIVEIDCFKYLLLTLNKNFLNLHASFLFDYLP